MIKLSTGVLVPEIKDLTNQQVFFLFQKPLDNWMPEDIKDYVKQGEKEFWKRDIKIRAII